MSDLEGMLRDIRAEVDYVFRMAGRGQLNAETLSAMRRVPRQQFVSKSFRTHAYENSPLPIGGGQTISQPFIVALMTGLVAPQTSDRVLEVGTGRRPCSPNWRASSTPSRYCRSLLRLPSTAWIGWGATTSGTASATAITAGPKTLTFDVIMVTGAVEHIPTSLIDQLSPGGQHRYTQDLILLRKDLDGEVDITRLLPVTCVPLEGQDQLGDCAGDLG
jgi:protein-L-isoaspartate(D-aspartate) O-methyltransferase